MTSTAIATITPLTILAKTALATSEQTQQLQFNAISKDMQNQLNQKIALLRGQTDQVSINFTQTQVTALSKQEGAISHLETTYGTNANIFGDLQNQITALDTAAGAGDSVGFDNALSAANTDLSNLGIAAFNGIFQPDGVAQLKTNGLGIGSSSSYDLSTPDGQAAAQAAVAAAKKVILVSTATTTANQVLATSKSTALNTQINSLQTSMQQQQSDQSAATSAQISQLQTNMQNALHVIELNIGNSNNLANALMAAEQPAQPVTSVFGALGQSVGETASSATQTANHSAPILSIFA